MNPALLELNRCRARWLKAKKAGDSIMMNLWKRVGLRLKEQLNKDYFKKTGEK